MYPISISIPSEKIVKNVPKKERVMAELIPGDLSTYRFGKGQEKEYYEMYQIARFAIDKKKGGWDAMRHYEILANGCIPIFENLEELPYGTMVDYPKQLVLEANKVLLPWTDDKEELYKYYSNKLLEYTKNNLTCEKNAEYFLNKLKLNKNSKILMLKGQPHLNYNRECLAIGLRRILGKEFIDYPKIDFLYSNCTEISEAYGMGYTYGGVLEDENIDRENIEEKIKNKYYDYIIYGKFGFDAKILGRIPTCEFWDIVSDNYKGRIAFLFGGDKIRNIEQKSYDRYTKDLFYVKDYGVSFIREFIMKTIVTSSNESIVASSDEAIVTSSDEAIVTSSVKRSLFLQMKRSLFLQIKL